MSLEYLGKNGGLQNCKNGEKADEIRALLLSLEGEVWGKKFCSHQKREENEHGGSCWVWVLSHGALALSSMAALGLRPKVLLGPSSMARGSALKWPLRKLETRVGPRGAQHGRAVHLERSQPALCHLVPRFICSCAPPVAPSLWLMTLLCGKT